MTILLSSTARSASEPDVLEAIKDQDVSLAIWERGAPEGLGALLDRDVRDVRFGSELATLESRLIDELDEAGFAPCPKRDLLVSDILELARRFCEVLSLNALDLRLEVVTTDACRKFHGDYVTARLITTYVGSGTQWLEEHDCERLQQGLEPSEIKQLLPGDVGLFKGKLASQHPAIHRSPPIEGSGEKRLLLVLNPA